MCKKSSKPAASGGAKSSGGGSTPKPERGAERARDVAQAAAPAAVANEGAESQGQGAMNRRRGRGKRQFRLAGQEKMALRPDRANVGGSGRSGLNIPRSS